ncbi:MAG TPA: nucleotidyltransferase domain-containing protein [Longimicrobiaceae bacterium]|nr:nucleotidyltransferase domain-containing protein [Longimicrobiaceae bacterium]
MGKETGRAERLAADLVRTYGEGVVSVVLYGSAARGEYVEGMSDLNVLVLLRDVAPATLRRASTLAREWVGEGNPPPLVMGVEEWRRSADVFPIELSDIRDAHRTLHGEEPFEGIRIDPAHLRLQCEHELKGKHIQLRERYLFSAGAPEELGMVLRKSLSTFLVLFRAVLRLRGEEGVREPEAVIRRTAERSGFDPGPLLEVLRARRDAGEWRPDPDSPVVTGYLEAVGRVVDYVDGLGDAAGGGVPL